MANEYYTAEEAMKVLNKPRSTFFKEVENGTIPSILEEGRKRGRRYPKEAIDLHAELQHKVKKLPLYLTFTRATNADVWEAVENSKRIYGEDDYIPYRKALGWRYINDEMTMSLKENGRLVGTSTIMPLEESVILSLIHDEMREKEIPDQAIKVWSDPKLSAYIAGVTIISSGNTEKDVYRGRFLLQHTIKWAIALYHQYDIKNFYGIGTTREGQSILDHLGFRLIANLENGERRGYVLADLKKPTKLINMFLSEAGIGENL